MPRQVGLAPSAIRDLDRTPPRYLTAILEFVYGSLAENPRRVGKPLRNEFAGLHSARRGDYRVLYEISGDDREEDVILVLRIEHRSRVYRS